MYLKIERKKPILTPEERQKRIDEEYAQIDAFNKRMFGDGEPQMPEEPVDWNYWAGKYETDRVPDWIFERASTLQEAVTIEYDINGDAIQAVAGVRQIPDVCFTNPQYSIVLPPFSARIAKTIGFPAKAILIKKIIFIKNMKKHPDANTDRNLLEGALYHADRVIFDTPQTKPLYRVLVKEGNRYSVVTLDFTESKKYIEVVGWRYANTKTYNELVRKAEKSNGTVQDVDWN